MTATDASRPANGAPGAERLVRGGAASVLTAAFLAANPLAVLLGVEMTKGVIGRPERTAGPELWR